MEIEVGSKVFHSLIIHKENNVPVQLEDRYVNPAEVPAYMEQDFSSITPNFYLSSIAPLVDAEHIIEAVVPQPWECKLLVVFKTEPCLAIKRRTWSSTGVVSVVRLIYPGSRYRLESRSKGIFL
jgi:GntR family histidine utilization transcriptional repressor